jgi:hypothetical protein
MYERLSHDLKAVCDLARAWGVIGADIIQGVRGAD